MRRWQLQEAKAKFSEVVKMSQKDGPQEISVHGKPVVVVISREEYDRLRGARPSFVAFLRQSPLVGAGLDLERDRSPTRDVPL